MEVDLGQRPVLGEPKRLPEAHVVVRARPKGPVVPGDDRGGEGQVGRDRLPVGEVQGHRTHIAAAALRRADIGIEPPDQGNRLDPPRRREADRHIGRAVGGVTAPVAVIPRAGKNEVVPLIPGESRRGHGQEGRRGAGDRHAVGRVGDDRRVIAELVDAHGLAIAGVLEVILKHHPARTVRSASASTAIEDWRDRRGHTEGPELPLRCALFPPP